MEKFIMVSMVALSLISAAQAAPILKDGKEIISKHPLAVEYRSKEYGGQLDAIDAYSDGVGVYVGTVNPDKRVNQAPMAELVEKYGESAKAKGVMVAEEVAYGVGTEADKNLLSMVIDINAMPSPLKTYFEPHTGLNYTDLFEVKTTDTLITISNHCQSLGMRLPKITEMVGYNPQYGILAFYSTGAGKGIPADPAKWVITDGTDSASSCRNGYLEGCTFLISRQDTITRARMSNLSSSWQMVYRCVK